MDVVSLLKAMYQNEKISKGGFAISAATITEAAKAWEKLREFGGAGWVCLSKSPEVLQFSEKGGIPEAVKGWILSAEAVNCDKSLHVTRHGAEWEFTTIEKIDGEDNSILTEKSMLCNRGGELRYEVAWKLFTAGNGDNAMEEYRPWAFRFTGFAVNQKEGK